MYDDDQNLSKIDIDDYDQLLAEFNEAACYDEIEDAPEVCQGRSGLLMRILEVELLAKADYFWLITHDFQASICLDPKSASTGLPAVTVNVSLTKQNSIGDDSTFTIWEDVETSPTGTQQRIYRTSYDSEIMTIIDGKCDPAEFILEKFSCHCVETLSVNDKMLFLERMMLYNSHVVRANPSPKVN